MLKILRSVAGIVYEISSYEKGKGKHILRSKTLWVNIITVVGLALSKWAGVTITAEDEVSILAVVNIFLRLISKEETGFIERPAQQEDKSVLGETSNQ